MEKANKLVHLIFILLLSLTFIFPSFGQPTYNIDVQHFTTDNGLAHREFFCTFQDSRGFIWVGTQYGLHRFDGHDFEVFTKEKHGLASNEVMHILEDADGW